MIPAHASSVDTSPLWWPTPPLPVPAVGSLFLDTEHEDSIEPVATAAISHKPLIVPTLAESRRRSVPTLAESKRRRTVIHHAPWELGSLHLALGTPPRYTAKERRQLSLYYAPEEWQRLCVKSLSFRDPLQRSLKVGQERLYQLLATGYYRPTRSELQQSLPMLSTKASTDLLARLRRSYRYTQKDLAFVLNAGTGAVTRWEREVIPLQGAAQRLVFLLNDLLPNELVASAELRTDPWTALRLRTQAAIAEKQLFSIHCIRTPVA